MDSGNWTIWDEMDYGGKTYDDSDDIPKKSDPFIDVTTTRDRGNQFSSTTGALTGQTVGSRTTNVGGGGDGRFNFVQHFDTGANQILTIGALFRYDSLRTTFDADPLVGTGSAASIRRDLFTAAGLFRYDIGNAYFGAGVAGSFGSGNWTDNVAAASANFRSHGFMAGGRVGYVFNLVNTRGSGSRPAMHTKAPPKPVDGYTLNLSVSSSLGYAQDNIGGFTDSSGFAWGNEQLRYWKAGAQAMLYANIHRNGYKWTPFAAATVDGQFGFSHTLDIPAQAGTTADTVLYGSPQTFWGGRLGLDITNPTGWNYGVEGSYSQSAQYQILGGRAYVRMPIDRWLGLETVASKN